MEELEDILYKACLTLDTSKISAVLKEGANINQTDECGEPLLCDIILELSLRKESNRYQVVQFLLDQGADPNLLDEDKCGPLTTAMLQMDAEMIELLCRHGAKPNIVAGFTDDETLYDWAEFDYQYTVYDFNLPEEPNEDDEKSEASWLAFLKHLAEKYGKEEPKHLFILRKYGARSWKELHGETH